MTTENAAKGVDEDQTGEAQQLGTSTILIIREASDKDEEQVLQLWRDCKLTAPYNDPSHDFRFAIKDREVNHHPSSTILVGTSQPKHAEAEIVGSVVCGHDGHRGWLYYVAVRPSQQTQGTGRRMVEAAQAWLSDRGVAKVQLLIREENTQVVSFYQRLGFEVTPRVVMAKWLT
ncbi:hypothetical protein CBS101457_002797 [Exobasidium rhododendri]|nr:hypothetical protein CBS101457_002797 [Exobasidium rhododendri]